MVRYQRSALLASLTLVFAALLTVSHSAATFSDSSGNSTSSFRAADTFPGPFSATWTFDGQQMTPTFVSPASSGAVFGPIVSAGPQVNPFGVMNNDGGTLFPDVFSYATQPQLRFGPDTSNAQDLAGARTNDVYIEWDITAPASRTVTFDEVTFDAARGGPATPRGVALFSSADGFVTPLFDSLVPTERTTYTNYVVDLSSLPTVAAGSTETFRMYVYTPGGNRTIELDNVTFSGEFA